MPIIDWFFNEAFSNYITFILGITIVPIISYFIKKRVERKRKSLLYVIGEPRYMLTFHSGSLALLKKGTLKLTYNGDQAIEPEFYRVKLKISNDGDVNIEKQDFKAPLILSFGEKVKILDIFSKTKPDDHFKVDVQKKPDASSTISVKPTTCWKKGYSVQIELYITGKLDSPDFTDLVEDSSVIEGIDRIKRKRTFYDLFKLAMVLGLIILYYQVAREIINILSTLPREFWIIVNTITFLVVVAIALKVFGKKQ